MNKAFSNKALPPGTVLREWRLEEVLGVGGFGIVYKGRGIYFDELVAIKEYFPSSISERDEDATVVPVDSNAQEVHALGLKKFVEEAKLLWNLSTPSRHPNIVSVRSLFEIHGTAYMVMDFEDGASLSRLLKQGRRFNEVSLMALVRPIAEGLERAHRVGVLHRDIKPPNILVTEDGRPVLIDFGSARFESGEATSTTVTFHTPPYAAIEQYVKTYDQGPWTDVYALGVVLYECVTGTKPPEVLERMHGGLGTALAAGSWPGYSRSFLKAVDAAMIIKPSERPQSISRWLEMFDREDTDAPDIDGADDGDATIVSSFRSEDILPVAPQLEGFAPADKVVTPVPTDPKEATFKIAGEDTSSGNKVPPAAIVSPPPAEDVPVVPVPEAKAELPASVAETPKAGPPAKGSRTAGPPASPLPAAKRPGGARKGLLAGAAAVLALAAAGVWYLTAGPGKSAAPAPAVEATGTTLVNVAVDGLAPAMQSLLTQAQQAGAPAEALSALTTASGQLAALGAQLKQAAAKPGQTDAVQQIEEKMTALARTASSGFAAALADATAAKARRMGRDIAWANPDNPAAAAHEPPVRQAIAQDVRAALAAATTQAAQAAAATEAGAALEAARQVIAASSTLNAAVARAYQSGGKATAKLGPVIKAEAVIAASPTMAQSVAPSAESVPSEVTRGAKGQASQLFPQKYRTFGGIANSARSTANEVIALANGPAPRSDASQDLKDGFRIRQANAQSARNYVKYLDTVVNSMRGERTEGEVDQLIARAEQTQKYLRQLQAGSRSTRR